MGCAQQKILVVDDISTNIVAMQSILKTFPAEIHTAQSGNEALSAMLRHQYRLVLIDIRMPEMDGYELARLMQENPETAKIPFIFVTAEAKDQVNIHQGYDLGAVDYLIKPLDKKILLAKINFLLSKQSKIDELEKRMGIYTKSENAINSDNGEIKPSVLVVDDKDENLYSMEMILKKLPINVVKSNSGKDALDKIAENDYSLILLDVQMPQMDGFQVAEKIRAIDERQALPIIFVTAINKEQKYVFQGYESGAVDYLFKPLDTSILLSKVKVFVQLYKNRQILQTLLHEKEGMIDQIKNQNSQLNYLAYHDTLTSIGNRGGFESILEESVQNALLHSNKFAILLIDVDHFKVINDAYGYDQGDLLLKEIAKRIQSAIEPTDYVARIGGDEFCVILRDIDNFSYATSVAENIINALSKTFTVLNKEFRLMVSIGISFYPIEKTNDNNISSKVVVRNADIAMYRAKEKRNSTFEFYTPEFGKKYHERLLIEDGLKFALERNEFFLIYQPKIDMKTNLMVGVEALLRWKHPEKGLISPAKFIPVLEDTYMIISIGEWVVREAFRQSQQWSQHADQKIKIAINLSAHQLVNKDFVHFLRTIIKESKIDPALIEFELTETAVMGDLSDIRAILFELNDLGFTLSIDDFGTGYSMLSYLKKLPVSTLKIDVEFIRDLLQNESSEVIVETIITLAKNFDLQVIAEGVETIEQAQFLMAHGCRYAQGFLYSKPLLPDQLLKFAGENGVAS